MLKLFYAPNACSLAPHIGLEEAGADYEAVRLDLKAGEQRNPDYLALNPKGRVPLLITDKGPISENPAILTWIAQAYPEAKLAPTGDAFAFAKFLSFCAGLSSGIHVNFAHAFRASRWSDDEAAQASLKAKAPANVAADFKTIEGQIKGPFVLGQDYSLADAYLFVFVRWGKNMVEMSAYPKVMAVHDAVAVRPATRKVLADEGLA
jgi:glutathione S-transferase